MRISSVRMTALALVALAVGWLGGWSLLVIMAPPPVADFVPTYSVAEAAERVAAARESQRVTLLNASRQLEHVSPATLPMITTVYFPQTGHHLSNRSGFLDFWRANGQIHIFGFPISEELVEDGRIVQYFERARFELSPEHIGTPQQVQLGLVGRELMAERYDGPFALIPDPQDGRGYFAETGHTLSSEFLGFWKKRGGLPIFGFPISEEFEENGRIVQYFERGHFSYNPEDMAPFFRQMEQYNGLDLDTLYEVVLGDIGRQLALARGVNIAQTPQIAGTAIWSPALWARHIEVNLSTQWLTAYEGNLVVYRAPVATGRDGFNTPPGEFAVYDKLTMQTMAGSAGGESWVVPNVPWVQYVVGGVALHGTYWHTAFGSGVRMSHGCINLSMDDARWLWEWADIGTTVTIHH